LRKDGRSQRFALADNLAANAADMVKAGHCARTMLRRAATVKPAGSVTPKVKPVLTIFAAL
jgi:hypothetical protein